MFYIVLDGSLATPFSSPRIHTNFDPFHMCYFQYLSRTVCAINLFSYLVNLALISLDIDSLAANASRSYVPTTNICFVYLYEPCA